LEVNNQSFFKCWFLDDQLFAEFVSALALPFEDLGLVHQYFQGAFLALWYAFDVNQIDFPHFIGHQSPKRLPIKKIIL
jgi:hypothetical protein